MHILFIHKNYPAQFGHIARHLVQRHGFRCTFISEKEPGDDHGIRKIQYVTKGGATARTHYCSRTFENYIWHSHAVYETLKENPDIRPDLVVSHSGFGTSLFLRDLYDCPIINYLEWYYRSAGSDLGFRTEFPTEELTRLRIRARNAGLLCDLQNCDVGYSPTQWQLSQMPNEYHYKLRAIFDGIDTDVWHPLSVDRSKARTIGDREFPAGTRIVSYVARGFESMRGFDMFMKIAKRICDERSDVVFVCAGSDRICYGNDMKYIDAKTFRHYSIENSGVDPSRVFFIGHVSTNSLVQFLNLSDLHIYLTVPFVLSWSMMNALACGCTVLASDTPPVREMIREGVNGLLAPFYDLETFARRALEVLDDPRSYSGIRDSAASRIESEYSLKHCLPRMLQLYQRASASYAEPQRSLPADAAELVLEETAPDDEIAARELRGLDSLHARFAWPSGTPTPWPIDQRSEARLTEDPIWDLLADALPHNGAIMLQLGAWTGTTTRFIAKRFPLAHVIAVDSWKGSGEDRPCMTWKSALPDAFDLFMANCRPFAQRVTPIPMTPNHALRTIHDFQIMPSTVYIHCHQVGEFEEQIIRSRTLFPNAPTIGTNWQWPVLQEFVERWAGDQNLRLRGFGNHWVADTIHDDSRTREHQSQR